MRTFPLLLRVLCAALPCALTGPPALATDVDGGNDCTRAISDYGSAPEGITAYPNGTIGAFPTCLAAGPLAFRTTACGAGGPAPGAAGYVRHVQAGDGNFWLGCYSTPAGPSGIDGETDGKSSLGGGPSACGAIMTDCVQTAFGSWTFGKDECAGDLSDAGTSSPGYLAICAMSSIPLSIYNCGTTQTAYLNICVDMNQDGDWLDALQCLQPASCAAEWSVVNVPFTLGPGCNLVSSSPFRVGPFVGPGWMRVTITKDPVPADFPWNGSASAPGGAFTGGETEDYPMVIDQPVPTRSATWGTMKTIYR